MPINQDLKSKVIILGVQIDDQPLDFVLTRINQFLNSDRQHLIFTPNPEICLQAEKNEHYRDILNDSSLNIPDGFGLKLGAKILGQNLNNRVTGADLSQEIIKIAPPNNWPIYILLRQDSLSTKASLSAFLEANYPKLSFQIGSVSPQDPFNCDKILNQINDFQPKILFSCLGAPNQELWLHKFLKLLPSIKLALGVGGAFDFLSGKIPRAPKFMRELGVEWLYRLYQEPQRLERVKNATANFLLACHRWKKRIQTTFRTNVLAIITHNQKFLIQKSAYFQDHWQFPQGGVDEDESPEQAVIREVSEELGAEPRFFKIIKKLPPVHNYTWLPHYQYLRGYQGQTQTAYLLSFAGQNQDIKIKTSREVEDFKWVAKNEILDNLHPVRRKFASQLIPYLP